MTDPDSLLERRLAGEHRTLGQPLRTLVRRPPVVCGERTTVNDALTVMHAEGIGSIVVVDGGTRPVGIFTERDLIGVVLEAGVGRPIAEVMASDPYALPGHVPAYEAALAMIDRRIRHVLVTEGDTLVGVVAERDLFSLQRLGLGEITMEIRLARNMDALIPLAARVSRLARLLVDEGVGQYCSRAW